MKKLVYSMALLLATTSVSAQSLWRGGNWNGGSGTYTAGQLGTMDYWPAAPNGQVLGWSKGSSTANTLTITEAEGRCYCANNNSTDKAAKMTMTSALGWQNSIRTKSYSTENANADWNPFEVTTGSTFYYSFWAKSDGAYPANKLCATINGISASYSAVTLANSINGNTSGLTTTWQHYVFKVKNSPAPGNPNQLFIIFTFQAAGTVYIDDVEISTVQPTVTACVTCTTTGIDNNVAEDNAPLSIIGATGGITFSSLGGQVSVYDITGKLAAQKEVTAGVSRIALPTGLYIVKLNGAAVKAIVK
jgi:hypothetical protein